MKMRLIDMDDLGVKQCSPDIFSADYCAGWNGLIRILENAPTVDAVPVVRCRDCRFLDRRNGACYCLVWTGYNGQGEGGFCNYGKRRETDG